MKVIRVQAATFRCCKERRIKSLEKRSYGNRAANDGAHASSYFRTNSLEWEYGLVWRRQRGLLSREYIYSSESGLKSPIDLAVILGDIFPNQVLRINSLSINILQ